MHMHVLMCWFELGLAVCRLGEAALRLQGALKGTFAYQHTQMLSAAHLRPQTLWKRAGNVTFNCYFYF